MKILRVLTCLKNIFIGTIKNYKSAPDTKENLLITLSFSQQVICHLNLISDTDSQCQFSPEAEMNHVPHILKHNRKLLLLSDSQLMVS